MFYTLIWGTDTGDRAIASPLELMMESLALHGGCGSLTVVALEGSDGWLESIRQLARSSGARCVDARAIFAAVESEYPHLRKTYGDYAARCFFRWPVLSRLVGQRPFGQVWHIDADMVFFAGLEELAGDTAGKTFILQGCPAFTSISRPEWFDGYERALRALHETAEPGFAVTADVRARHRRRDLELGNATVYRIPLAHDQDLLQCLVGEGRLPQDPFSVVRGNRFYYMQNPLCLRAWHRAVVEDAGAMFEDRGDAICVGPRQVPFIHFQADAARYFEAYRRAALMHAARWLPHPFSDPSDHASDFSRGYGLAVRLLIPERRVDRGAVMRRFFAAGHARDRRQLTDALNHLLGEGRS